MNVKKRVRELIGGIAFAIIFAVFGYWSCKVAVHSSDATDYETYALNRNYGYDRVAYLKKHGRLEEAEAAQEEYDFWMIDEGLVEPETPEPEAVPETAAAAVPTPEPTPEPIDPDSPKGRALAKGLPAPPEININDWQYILVNPTHELESTYEPPQLAYLNMTGDDTDIRYDYDGNRQMVDSRIAQPLVDFSQGCKAAGLPVYLSSGYRAYTEQSYLFNRKLNQGYSYDVAKTIVAYPGTSEHQTGMCCDITDYYHELKDESLAQTETYK